MNAAMVGRYAGPAIFVAMAALAGCSGYSEKSNFTPPSVPLPLFAGDTGAEGGDGKGTVLLSASIAGLTCAQSRIVLARASGQTFKTAQVLNIDSQFGGGAAAAVADLAPGTYHVVNVACRNGNNVVSVGGAPDSKLVPWQTETWTSALASFALTNGEVLDAGVLSLNAAPVKGFTQSIAKRKVTASVEASGTAALGEVTRLRPELASTLRSRLMVLAASGPLMIGKCKLVAPAKPVTATGATSTLANILAVNPDAAPLLKTIGSTTAESERCVAEGKANDQLLSAAAKAAEAAK